MSSQTEVTLRNSAGRKIGTIPIEALLANIGHFHVRYNKRGNIKHAIRKARLELSPLSNNGTAFEQELNSGRVWALNGVDGSDRPKMGEVFADACA